MINKDMYSLCIDIHNKLFTGKLHFASGQVWSIKAGFANTPNLAYFTPKLFR